MRKTKAILFGAVAGLGLTAAVQAAPIVNTRLTLLTVDTGSGSTVIPVSGDGKYHLNVGQHFLLQLGSTITPGTENLTDTATGRATVTRNQPLGIQNMTVDILASSHVAPVNAGDGTWSGYAPIPGSQAEADGFTYASQPIGDSNKDADALPFDLPGAGFANNSLTTGTTAASLGKAQYGVTGKTVEYLLGEFAVTDAVGGTISVAPQAVNAFVENAGNNNNLDAVDNTANALGTSVQIIVPEPASLGLLGLVGLAFGRRRRA